MSRSVKCITAFGLFCVLLACQAESTEQEPPPEVVPRSSVELLHHLVDSFQTRMTDLYGVQFDTTPPDPNRMAPGMFESMLKLYRDPQSLAKLEEQIRQKSQEKSEIWASVQMPDDFPKKLEQAQTMAAFMDILHRDTSLQLLYKGRKLLKFEDRYVYFQELAPSHFRHFVITYGQHLAVQ